MRDEGWENFYKEDSNFCEKNKVENSKTDDVYILLGRSRRNVQEVITNLYYFRVELFYVVIDMNSGVKRSFNRGIYRTFFV